MEKVNFFKRKDIEFSVKRYVQDGLSAMALGLFASLLVGLIIKTAGQQISVLSGIGEDSLVLGFLITLGTTAMKMVGASIGVAVAWGLKAPPIVIFVAAVTGYMGNELGGPAGAFIAVAVGSELGKAVYKETKVDIIVTPATALFAGGLAAVAIGPSIGKMMSGIGAMIQMATEWQPFLFGIFIAVVVGLALTAPISSAALCIMLDLGGLAAGAATVGCCAQMVGFAVISYRDNGIGGLMAQGVGTSMLQISNIIRCPWILIPPVVAGAVIGPISTCLFKMTNNSMGAGMGTSGFVGQIGTFADMGFSFDILWKVMLLHFILPAAISYALYTVLRKMGKIKDGDMRLEI